MWVITCRPEVWGMLTTQPDADEADGRDPRYTAPHFMGQVKLPERETERPSMMAAESRSYLREFVSV